MELLPFDGLGPVLGFCLSAAAVAALLALLDKIWPPDVRRRHNDITGFMISVIAVIYAILLGFVTFTVWENYDKAAAAVDTEVNLVADIYRDAGSLPGTSTTAIRRDILSYLRAVVDEEWQAQASGACQARQSALNDIPQRLQAAAKLDPAAGAFVSEIVSRLNQLYDARRARLFACNRSLPVPIWIALAAGSASLIGTSLLFGCHSRGVHMTMTALLFAAMGLVFWIVLDLSTPFQGTTAISPDVYWQMLRFLESG